MRLLRSDLSFLSANPKGMSLFFRFLRVGSVLNLCLRSIWAFLLDSIAHFCFSGFYTICVVFSSWFYSDDDDGISVYLNRAPRHEHRGCSVAETVSRLPRFSLSTGWILNWVSSSLVDCFSLIRLGVIEIVSGLYKLLR